MLRPDACQVVTYAPDGSSPRWLGALGSVSQLKYSFTCPGGPAQMSCTLQKEAAFRTDAMNPGRIVRVIRGASVVWDGKLDEPQPSPTGWSILAHGAGTLGDDFVAHYTGAWSTNPDSSVNAAITRGLRWINPGIGAPAGIWLGQAVDSSAQTITALLNLATQKGSLTWYVNCRPRGNVLAVFPLPTAPTRLLVATNPVARTLGGDISTVWLRYMHDADTGVPAVFADTSVSEPGSVTAHGAMEAYADLSSAGVMTAAGAQVVGRHVLDLYQRASFSGPFIVRYGDLMTLGGTPVDLGTEQAAGVCRLVMADYGYGGEITAGPVSFIVGTYEYDDDAQTAAVTPFQSVRANFATLLGVAASMGPSPAMLRYQRMEREADLDIIQEAQLDVRQEALRDRSQLKRWERRHPHWRRDHGHHPKF